MKFESFYIMNTTRLNYLAAEFCTAYPMFRPIFRKYKDSLLVAHRKKAQNKFLKQCYQEKVMPKTFLPVNLRNFKNKPFSEIDDILLKEHIRKSKNETADAFRILKKNEGEFYQKIPNGWINTLLDCIMFELRLRTNQLKIKLQDKLECLFRESLWVKGSNPSKVTNLSSHVLTENEKLVLGYGLNFSSVSTSPNIAVIYHNFIRLRKTTNISNEDFGIMKGLIYSTLTKKIEPNLPLRFTNALKHLKKDNSIKICKADKSNTVVIIDQIEYDRKLDELLSDAQTYEVLNRDPTKKHNKEINQKMKLLLKNRPNLITEFSTFTPKLPHIYGLVKIHKVNNPLRPIVSSIGSVTYKLSKWLVKEISPLVGNIADSTVKNSQHFIEKAIKEPTNVKLISFDVTSLFTKVPIDLLLEYLKTEVTKLNIQIESHVFLKLIELCIRNNVFMTHNRIFYKQIFGMSMGNPLSATLANLFMECFETKLLPSIKKFHLPWIRYVDDILCFWPHDKCPLDFLTKLNNLCPSIKFTMEKENNKTINFLDVKIFKTDNKFEFSVYRKATNADAFIHFFSDHRDNIKKEVIKSMFLRAYRICCPKYIDEEIIYIKDTFSKLWYPPDFIECCLNLARKTFYNTNPPTPFENKNCLVLPYFSKFEEIIPTFRDLGIKIVFSYPNTLKQILIRNTPIREENIVYAIPCKTCPQLYVGQTGNTLEERVNQHKRSITRGDNVAVFKHLENFNHHMNWAYSKVIYRNNNKIQREVIEACFIKNLLNCNGDEGVYHIDEIMNNLFKKDQFFQNILKNT